MQDFWKEHQFIAVDARYGGMPVDASAQLFGGKPKAKGPAKRWDWEDCKDLAKVLNEDWEPKLKITLGRNAILFADGSSFEHGKRYGYRNPSQCYESLLSLQRDRLARMSDDDAIAAGIAAKQFFN